MNYLRIVVFTLLALAIVASLADAEPKKRRPRPPKKHLPPPPKKHLPIPPKKHLPPPPKKHIPRPIPKKFPTIPLPPKNHYPPKYHAPVAPPKYLPRPKYHQPCHVGTFNNGYYNRHNDGYFQFYCNNDYYLLGSRRMNCYGGSWQSSLPRCQRRCHYQAPTHYPANCYALNPNDIFYEGQKLNYGCRNNMVLQGDPYRTCRGGKFDGVVPRCVAPNKYGGPYGYGGMGGYLPFLNKY